MSDQKIDETTVNCPPERKAAIVMTGWGTKKRQRYAQLVSEIGYKEYQAFYIVEYCDGDSKTITPFYGSTEGEESAY